MMLTTITTPKCTVSIANPRTDGISSGTRIGNNVIVSRNAPKQQEHGVDDQKEGEVREVDPG